MVRAAKIVSINRDALGEPKSVNVIPDERSVDVFAPTHAIVLKDADIGDWAILYPDGFKSISPAKAFEEGYTRKP